MNVYIGKAEVSVLQLHVPAHSECQIKCIYSEKSRTFLSLKYVWDDVCAQIFRFIVFDEDFMSVNVVLGSYVIIGAMFYEVFDRS